MHVCCAQPGCDDRGVHTGPASSKWRRETRYDMYQGSVAVCLDTGAWHVCWASFLKAGGHPSMHGMPDCPALTNDVRSEGSTLCVMTGCVLDERRVATFDDMQHWAGGTSMQSASSSAIADMLRSGGGASGNNTSTSKRMQSGGGTVVNARVMQSHHNADIANKIARYKRLHKHGSQRQNALSALSLGVIATATVASDGGASAASIGRKQMIVRAPSDAAPSPRSLRSSVPPTAGILQTHPSTTNLRRLATMHAERAAAAVATSDLDVSGGSLLSPGVQGAGGVAVRSTLVHTVSLAVPRKRRSRGVRHAAHASDERQTEKRTATFIRGDKTVIMLHRLDACFTLTFMMSDRRTQCDYTRLGEREESAMVALRRAAAEGRASGVYLGVPQLLCMFHKLVNEPVPVIPFMAPQDAPARAALFTYMYRLVLRVWHSITSTHAGRNAVLSPPINGDFRTCVFPIVALLAQGVCVTCPRVVADLGTVCPVTGGQVWVVQRDDVARRMHITDRVTVRNLGIQPNIGAIVIILRTALATSLYDPGITKDAERWINLYDQLHVVGSLLPVTSDKWMNEINLLDREAPGTTRGTERPKKRANTRKHADPPDTSFATFGGEQI